MSGVDRSEKKNQIHTCESCMNTIIQTFSHFQDQIIDLNHDKKKLQMELKKSKKGGKPRYGNAWNTLLTPAPGARSIPFTIPSSTKRGLPV